jgi:hypothetical protein
MLDELQRLRHERLLQLFTVAVYRGLGDLFSKKVRHVFYNMLLRLASIDLRDPRYIARSALKALSATNYESGHSRLSVNALNVVQK